ncbi:hypothetical protein GF324_00315 [bacterium]|nr:hypothetical protein [bacterium]
MQAPLGKKNLQKLARKKYRREWGLYLLEGVSQVRDALAAGAPIREILFSSENLQRERDRALIEAIASHGAVRTELSHTEWKGISDLDTPPGLAVVVAREKRADPSIPPPEGLTLALDAVADPGNVGTLLRVAAFYGIAEVWLGEGTVELHNPKVLRAAMAMHLHVRVCEEVDLQAAISESQQHGAEVFAADVSGEFGRPQPASGSPRILVLGSEAHGLSLPLLERADRRLAIARRGPVDSLNVAVAGAILVDRLLADQTE